MANVNLNSNSESASPAAVQDETILRLAKQLLCKHKAAFKKLAQRS